MEKECVLLYSQVFGGDPPPGFSVAYQQAQAMVLSAWADSREAAQIKEAVRLGWDLEALEFALRLRNKGNLLSKKMNILFYVAETSPANLHRFVNLQSQTRQGWLALATQALRAAYLLPKGWFLARRLAALAPGTTHG